MTDHVTLSVKGSIATITLDRPDKKNALSQAMWQRIPAIFAKAQEEGARAVILTGAGGSFAAGADISEFETVYATPESAAAYSADIAQAMDAVAGCALPVIAQVEGACVGGGCGLALASDLRFAATNAKFAITPSKLGLVYSLNDTKRLVDAVGFSRAKDILFSGRLIKADEALAIGLVDELVDNVQAAVETYVHSMVANSGFSLRTTKEIIGQISAGQMADDDKTLGLFLSAFEGQDFKEGYKAFLEKRKPGFSG